MPYLRPLEAGALIAVPSGDTSVAGEAKAVG